MAKQVSLRYIKEIAEAMFIHGMSIEDAAAFYGLKPVYVKEIYQAWKPVFLTTVKKGGKRGIYNRDKLTEIGREVLKHYVCSPPDFRSRIRSVKAVAEKMGLNYETIHRYYLFGVIWHLIGYEQNAAIEWQASPSSLKED